MNPAIGKCPDIGIWEPVAAGKQEMPLHPDLLLVRIPDKTDLDTAVEGNAVGRAVVIR